MATFPRILSATMLAIALSTCVLLAGCDCGSDNLLGPAAANSGANTFENPPGNPGGSGTIGATDAFTSGPDTGVAFVLSVTRTTSDGSNINFGNLEIRGNTTNLSPTSDSTSNHLKLTGTDANGTKWTVDVPITNPLAEPTATVDGSNGDTATTVLKKQ